MTQEWKEKRQEAINWLYETFPKTFNELKPIKVGIFNDIRDFEGHNKPANIWIRRALHMHTSRIRYLKNSTVGSMRIDLVGQGAGEVTLDEENNAKKMLFEKKAKNQENIKKNQALKVKRKKTKNIAPKNDTEINQEIGVIGEQILAIKKKNKIQSGKQSEVPVRDSISV